MDLRSEFRKLGTYSKIMVSLIILIIILKFIFPSENLTGSDIKTLPEDEFVAASIPELDVDGASFNSLRVRFEASEIGSPKYFFVLYKKADSLGNFLKKEASRVGSSNIYECSLNSLDAETEYVLSSQIENADGEIRISDESSRISTKFLPVELSGPASVPNLELASINSLTVNYDITDVAGGPSMFFILWRKTGQTEFLLENAFQSINPNIFTTTIKDLEPNTSYEFKSKIENPDLSIKESDVSVFNTLETLSGPAGIPFLDDSAESTLSLSVKFDTTNVTGNPSVFKIYYKKATDTKFSDVTATRIGLSSFYSATVLGLNPLTFYNFKSYIQNEGDFKFSETSTIQTLSAFLPYSIEKTSSSLKIQFSSNGLTNVPANVNEYGFYWGNSENPSVYASVDSSLNGVHTKLFNNLNKNTVYYFESVIKSTSEGSKLSTTSKHKTTL